jgi:hypothetical protein
MSTNDYLASFNFRDLLIDSPLNSIVPAYIETLFCQRYAKRTIEVYLSSVTHFGCWMKTNDVGLLGIDLSIIECFLQEQCKGAAATAYSGST